MWLLVRPAESMRAARKRCISARRPIRAETVPIAAIRTRIEHVLRTGSPFGARGNDLKADREQCAEGQQRLQRVRPLAQSRRSSDARNRAPISGMSCMERVELRRQSTGHSSRKQANRSRRRLVAVRYIYKK